VKWEGIPDFLSSRLLLSRSKKIGVPNNFLIAFSEGGCLPAVALREGGCLFAWCRAEAPAKAGVCPPQPCAKVGASLPRHSYSEDGLNSPTLYSLLNRKAPGLGEAGGLQVSNIIEEVG